jgi:hypothetical protein
MIFTALLDESRYRRIAVTFEAKDRSDAKRILSSMSNSSTARYKQGFIMSEETKVTFAPDTLKPLELAAIRKDL